MKNWIKSINPIMVVFIILWISYGIFSDKKPFIALAIGSIYGYLIASIDVKKILK